MTRIDNLDNQNIDTFNDNPLISADSNQTTPSQNAEKLLKQPKYKLLLGLLIFLGILIILSFLVLIFKKKPTTTTNSPTPTLIQPTPTINQSQIPLDWQKKLHDRETETKIEENFLPPQIDTNIGL